LIYAAKSRVTAYAAFNSEKEDMPRGQGRDGFLSGDGRLVYSILFTLECAPPKCRQLVVPLGADGTALNGCTRPADPNKRIVNVGRGDSLRFKHERFIVSAVEAYRWVKASVVHSRT
jgi:hypothetical protein